VKVAVRPNRIVSYYPERLQTEGPFWDSGTEYSKKNG
jgi:hypothetical protein